MPCQKRDEGCQKHNHEKWQAGDSGCLSQLRYQDVQDREELALILQLLGFGERLAICEQVASLLVADYHKMDNRVVVR